MKVRVGYCAIALFTGLSLSACSSSSSSGGGSGGGSSDDSSSVANEISLPRNGTIELDGSAVTAEFATNALGFSVDEINAPEASTLRITTENGEIVSARFVAPGSSATLDSRSGDTRVRNGAAVAFDAPDLNEGALLIDPSRSRFEYQTFGVWLEGRREATGTAGAGSYGSRTPTRDIPTGRNVTYDGVSTGFARLADGDPYLTASDINVTTNFRTATITSRGTQATNLAANPDRAAPELDFSGSGDVSGSGFRARVSGTGTSGTANGIFYGPNAEEVGGTFRTTGAGGVNYIGSFGAD